MLETKIIESRAHEMIAVYEYKNKDVRGDYVLLFNHGFVGNKITPHRMAVNLSRKILDMGITTVRFDCVGAGDSEGDYEYMTINGEVEDTLNVVEVLKKDFNMKKLFMMGYSMGGAIAALSAAEVNPDALILWSPVSNPFWNFYHLIGHEKFMKGINGNDVDVEGDMVSRKFFEDIIKIDPIRKIKNFENPVRIIHGSKDNDILPINSIAYKSVLRDVKVKFIDEADHCYSSAKFQSQLIEETSKFIIELLK
ncbi:alpha/beta fold hydrolase [Acidilutibacter cellobiosedens]|jgi:hypothetical protein|uniref:Alpha/beta fold hydrolase n=1 Tax=Acidilutibacter cellobiosedens TaxID=2507161 RepID=A0A410QEI4_9FIRM|nr:alpha/beta fold hydrolase [Acidilutibacter cellobiosedens]QAT62462.1 alpha/beta fold hydrolase [Acidilutibacter cellobiosedens]